MTPLQRHAIRQVESQVVHSLGEDPCPESYRLDEPAGRLAATPVQPVCPADHDLGPARFRSQEPSNVGWDSSTFTDIGIGERRHRHQRRQSSMGRQAATTGCVAARQVSPQPNSALSRQAACAWSLIPTQAESRTQIYSRPPSTRKCCAVQAAPSSAARKRTICTNSSA